MKIKIITLILTMLFLSITFSPIIDSSDELIENQEKITIEINNYLNNKQEKTFKELNIKEAEELKEYLTNLDQAIKNQDENEIKKYEDFINKKELLGEEKLQTYSKTNTQIILNKIQNFPYTYKLKNLLQTNSSSNISNSMCFFNAVGTGTLFFTIGVMLLAPTVALVNLFGGDILKILVPIYLLIMLFTHIIPFRIMLPAGILLIDEGNASATGLMGSQKMQIIYGTQITLGGFTGITISIPFTDDSQSDLSGFLFVSGFSLIARTKES